jgi:hypothetical protein
MEGGAGDKGMGVLTRGLFDPFEIESSLLVFVTAERLFFNQVGL